MMECFHHLEVLTVIRHLHLRGGELVGCFAKSHQEVMGWDVALTQSGGPSRPVLVLSDSTGAMCLTTF